MARDQRLTKEEIQEDKFIEGLLTTYQFLKEHLRTIIIVVGIVLIAVAGLCGILSESGEPPRRSHHCVAGRHRNLSHRRGKSFRCREISGK